MSYIYIISSILLGALGQISMKYGVNRIAPSSGLIDHLLNIWVLLGLSIYGVSAIIWIFALSKVPLSYAYPMVSLGYVVVIFMSFFIFKEPISILRLAGLLTIIAGVWMIAKS